LILGTLIAAISPYLIRRLLDAPEGPAQERAVFFRLSVLYAPAIVLAALWCVKAIGEPSGRSQRQRKRGRFSIDFAGLRQNRPFCILLAAYTVAAIGSNLPATLILYYVEYVLDSRSADLFLLLYFSVGIACLPFWVKLAGRIGKKAAWILSMVVNTGAFSGVFFLGAGDAAAYGVLVAISGMGFGATLALPSAIQADTIDYDELLSGQRREGRYVGVWSISKKLAAAVGVGVALFVLGRAGYVPNAEQSEAVKTTLRVFYALVPVLCNLIAIGIVSAYPIGREKHMAIREAVRLRGSGTAVRDPLRPARILEPAPSEG
jgi:GPH family glycoside/pentoside/hexuronide:cation symporter